MIAYIFMGLTACLMVGCAMMMWRNTKVYEARTKMLHTIGNLSLEDARDGYAWEWRFKEMEKVEYQEMVFKFWKPIDSFFPDKRFLDPETKVMNTHGKS